ncbi:MAG: hypothetical protein AAF602_24420 [Myxococcota bacterium]
MRFVMLSVLVACGSAVDPPETGCGVGETEACPCDGGGEGVRACVAPPDGWSECGCDTGPVDLFVPPPEPLPMVCPTDAGEQACPPYRGDDATEAGASHCCTETDACGSEASFLFGDQCVARDGPGGVPSAECPDEFPNFLDLFGCCRPDGQCGLSVDHVSNWDIGCVERSEMAALLNGGSQARDTLSLVFFLPIEDAAFEPLLCNP